MGHSKAMAYKNMIGTSLGTPRERHRLRKDLKRPQVFFVFISHADSQHRDNLQESKTKQN